MVRMGKISLATDFTDFTGKPRYFATNFHELTRRNFGHREKILNHELTLINTSSKRIFDADCPKNVGKQTSGNDTGAFTDF